MDWLDGVIVFVLLLAALHGLRVGALVQVLSLVGFALGVTVGALSTDVIAPSLHTAMTKTVVSIALVVGLGAVFGVLGRVIGTHGNLAARRLRLGPVDSLLGLGVALVTTLFVVWLLANELVVAPYIWLSSAIEGSRVVRAVDDVMPPLPGLFSRVQTFLGASGFPPVFSELEPVPAHVTVPSTTAADAFARSAEASTVKVLGQACGYVQEGSAFVVGPGAVVTNAHVVAGEKATTVVVGGQVYPATTVYFDPTYDLAILRTTAPLGPVLTIDPSTATAGTKAAVIGYPEDGPLMVDPAAVAQELTAQGRNIYGEGTVTRQVLEIDAHVEPGNSGGPLVDPTGQVIGVVFSRSTVYPHVGYALASPGVRQRVLANEGRTAAVGTGNCTSG